MEKGMFTHTFFIVPSIHSPDGGAPRRAFGTSKITIEGVFPSHPTDRIFKCILDGEALELGLQRLQPINSNARTPQVAA